MLPILETKVARSGARPVSVRSSSRRTPSEMRAMKTMTHPAAKLETASVTVKIMMTAPWSVPAADTAMISRDGSGSVPYVVLLTGVRIITGAQEETRQVRLSRHGVPFRSVAASVRGHPAAWVWGRRIVLGIVMYRKAAEKLSIACSSGGRNTDVTHT
jgi:hypothetical protein